MLPPAASIRLATWSDIPALMELESRYYVGALTPAERADGFVSTRHGSQWFSRAVEAAGVHVAVSDDGEVQGFMAVTAPSEGRQVSTSPIIQAMSELAVDLRFNGTPIAQQRYAFRGPVLIDRMARGRGLYSAFNDVMREAYRERFDVGVLFVAVDNHRSVHTTTTKLGATSLAVFDVAGRAYHFMAFTFSS